MGRPYSTTQWSTAHRAQRHSKEFAKSWEYFEIAKLKGTDALLHFRRLGFHWSLGDPTACGARPGGRRNRAKPGSRTADTSESQIRFRHVCRQSLPAASACGVGRSHRPGLLDTSADQLC